MGGEWWIFEGQSEQWPRHFSDQKGVTRQIYSNSNQLGVNTKFQGTLIFHALVGPFEKNHNLQPTAGAQKRHLRYPRDARHPASTTSR